MRCDWIPRIWLLAQQGGNGGGGGGLLPTMWPSLILIAVLFYFMMIRPERSKQKQQQAMLAGLKKNDRVVTIGGVYGIVTNVVREADEVTLRVDENNNTKITFTVSSIARVLSSETKDEKPGT